MEKMKLPKTFVPRKSLDKDLEELLRKDYDPKSVDELILKCEEFIRLVNEPESGSIYEITKKLARKTNCNKADLQVLYNRIIVEDHWLGFYLGALVNKVIGEDDTIIIKPANQFNAIMSFLKRGTVIIENDVGTWAGSHMEGGRLIIEGNAGYFLGSFSKGGIIEVYGKIDGLPNCCQATIYQNEKKIWPKE